MNTKLLRQKILDLAIRGKLTEQKKSDGTTKDLLKSIAASSNVIAKASSNDNASEAKQSKKKQPVIPKEIIPLDKNEAPFEIPENWEWVRLGDLCVVVRGRSPRPADSELYYNGNIPFMKVGDITKDNLMYVDCCKHTIKEAGLSKTRQIPSGTLLLSNSGATLGVPKINTFETAINDGIAAFLELQEDLRFYLYWFFKSKTNELRKVDQGDSQPNLNTDLIKDLRIPLPPLAEQQRIVEAIETAFAEITAIENNWELLKKHIKHGRQKILDLAIRGELSEQKTSDGTTAELLKKIIPLGKAKAPFEIPESWEWVRLGDVCSVCNGFAFIGKQFKAEGFPIIRISNISNGEIDLSNCVYTSDSQASNFEVHEGDLLIAMSGAKTGKIGVYRNKERAFFNQRVGNIKITAVNLIIPEYRNWFLSSQADSIRQMAYGGAQPNISAKDILEMPIPLPPLAEQQRIVATIKEFFAEFDAIEAALLGDKADESILAS